MAFNAGAVEGRLELDAKGFVDALNRAQKALDRMEKETKQTAKGFTSFRNALSLVRDAMIVLPGLFRAVSAPLRGLVGFLKESSSAAASFEQTVRKLAVSLALQGVNNVKAFTRELESFASGLQDTTKFSDELVLEVAQVLTVLGVTEDKLKSGVTAVLNYSAAMGTEARQGAINFGKTLGGVVGELGEAFPAVKELTIEALKNGAAFDLANEAMAGFAEQTASTTQGIRAQFVNALGDLQKAVGFAINPVFDAITKAGTEAVKVLTASVKANEGEITAVFESIARSTLGILRGVADAALDVPVMVAQAKAFIAQVVAAVRVGSTDLEITLTRVFVNLRAEVAAFVDSLSEIPAVGAALIEPANRLKASVSEARVELAAMERNVDAIKAPFIAAAKAAEAQAVAARAAAAAIRDGTEDASTLAKAYQTVVGFIDTAVAGLDDMEREVRDVEIATLSSAGSAKRTLDIWKNVTAATQDTAAAVGQVANNTAAASAATRQLTQEANNAAAAFVSVASAAGSPGASRRRGGKFGLNLDDPFSGLAELGNLERRLTKVGGGLFGRAQRQSARAVTEQVRAVVQGQIDNAFREFTADILRELSSLGVMDPAERAAFVNQRLGEAIRLGVLPERGAASSGTGLVRF